MIAVHAWGDWESRRSGTHTPDALVSVFIWWALSETGRASAVGARFVSSDCG